MSELPLETKKKLAKARSEADARTQNPLEVIRNKNKLELLKAVMRAPGITPAGKQLMVLLVCYDYENNTPLNRFCKSLNMTANEYQAAAIELKNLGLISYTWMTSNLSVPSLNELMEKFGVPK